MTYCPNSKSIGCPSSNNPICSSLPSAKYSLTDKRSSCENEISTVNCLVYRSSASVPRTRRIWLYRRTRQKERGNQQSIKSEKFFRKILVSLWLHIDGALSITIYNNEKFNFFVVTMPLFTFFFAREKWSAIDEVCAKLHGNWTVTGRWSSKTIENQQKTSARVHSIKVLALYREQRLLQRWAVFWRNLKLTYVNVRDESELNKMKCHLILAKIVNCTVVVIARGKI